MPFYGFDWEKLERDIKYHQAIPGGHAAERMRQREFTRVFDAICASVVAALAKPDKGLVEYQGPDRVVLLSQLEGRPLHTTWIITPDTNLTKMTTVYRPDERPDLWEPDWKTRKPRTP